jgi:hypothetical protein
MSIRVVLVLLLLTVPVGAAAAPQGEMTWAVHVSLAPTWFDPAETPSVVTPFMILYALHDALVKPMPGNRIQQLMHERSMFAPIVEPAFLSGHGARVEHSSFGAVVGMPYSVPYEDIRLKPAR